MGLDEHKRAANQIALRCAVITLSDTRDASNDRSGARIKDMLLESRHAVADYAILPDDPALLRAKLLSLAARPDVDVILTNGGTGISPRDQTIDALEKLLDQTLPGFGELFRMLSFDQIGSAAILSRAAAGVISGKPVFAMPGSTKAVELAMSKLILPEIAHVVAELRK